MRKILKKYKIGKHFTVKIKDDGFDYNFDEDGLVKEVTTKSKGDKNLIDNRLQRADCHIDSIGRQLAKIDMMTKRGKLYGKDEIGVRVGKVVNKYKVGKHFDLDIRDDSFNFEVNQDKVQAEAALDGIYIVRTSLPRERMSTDETVRSYKQLSRVERAFRSFKTVDLMVRPIHHRIENRVRAHILLCMLAYYVQWHMMEAWRPLLYADEEQEAKDYRDPVEPSKRSDSAMEKVTSKQLEDGSAVHSFRTLLDHLGAIVRATCRCLNDDDKSSTFTMDTKPNQKQQKALELLQTIEV